MFVDVMCKYIEVEIVVGWVCLLDVVEILCVFVWMMECYLNLLFGWCEMMLFEKVVEMLMMIWMWVFYWI